jgi:hypothetical protein
VIELYVIYSYPSDYPESPFVMRLHHLADGKVKPTKKVWTGTNLDDVREQIPRGLVRMDRSEGDEPQIVEWWH